MYTQAPLVQRVTILSLTRKRPLREVWLYAASYWAHADCMEGHQVELNSMRLTCHHVGANPMPMPDYWYLIQQTIRWTFMFISVSMSLSLMCPCPTPCPCPDPCTYPFSCSCNMNMNKIMNMSMSMNMNIEVNKNMNRSERKILNIEY
jgi:hypothetical protein